MNPDDRRLIVNLWNVGTRYRSISRSMMAWSDLASLRLTAEAKVRDHPAFVFIQLGIEIRKQGILLAERLATRLFQKLGCLFGEDAPLSCRQATSLVKFEPLPPLVCIATEQKVELNDFRVTPARRGKCKRTQSEDESDQTPAEKQASMTWAKRLKRVFDIDIA